MWIINYQPQKGDCLSHRVLRVTEFFDQDLSILAERFKKFIRKGLS